MSGRVECLIGLIGLLILGPLAPGAHAQVTRSDAITNVATQTTASGAANTINIGTPPLAGQHFYIVLIEVRQYAVAALTGGATPVTVTSQNLPGNPTWTFQTALAIGTSEAQIWAPSTPLQTSSSTVATRIQAPATTNVIWTINIWYYAAP